MRRITDLNTARLSEQEKRKAARSRGDWPDEVEITMDAPLVKPLDTAPGLYERDRERLFGGINTSESVFDRQALFRRGDKDKS